MRTYEELVPEFASKSREGKQEWIDELPIEELKTLREGLFNYFKGSSWVVYIDLVISKRIREEREKKLNDLRI